MYTLCLPTSHERKRNCRFKFDRSIVSISVTMILPTPIMAKFFNSSQPMAPDPTINHLWLNRVAWKAAPKQAVWEQYRSSVIVASVTLSATRHSCMQRYHHCLVGVNLPETALTASWAATAPITDVTGWSWARQVKANLRAGSSSTSGLKPLTISTKLSASFSSCGFGSWPYLLAKK